MNRFDPVMLCHAACSGGSLLYKMIVAQFGFQGISEISHCYPFEQKDFMPTDPEHALLLEGAISIEEYADIFFDRVLNCLEVAQRTDKRLLIREHSHSYFFAGVPESQVPTGPSWIAQQFNRRFGRKLKCIITIRDPVDSWLGLVASFPLSAPTSFAQYCRDYETFARSFLDHWDEETMMLVRYEDVIKDQGRETRRMAAFLGIPGGETSKEAWWSVPSSGNSGRQSRNLAVRPRRPFGVGLLRDAKISESYRYLVERLGYPDITHSITATIKVKAIGVEIWLSLKRCLLRAKRAQSALRE